MAWRCGGSKKPPSMIYRRGDVVGKLASERFYGVGKCARCGRVVGLAPKSNLVVRHAPGAGWGIGGTGGAGESAQPI